MEVKLRIVGCSPAWPNPGGAQSGYLVEAAEGRLLLDCGPGVLGRLREWEDWPRVDAIAITHWHLDHWGDLVPWVWAAQFGPARELAAPEVWVPPGGRGFLSELGAGRLPMKSARNPLAWVADMVASVLATPFVLIVSVPLEAIASLAGRGGRMVVRVDAASGERVAELDDERGEL